MEAETEREKEQNEREKCSQPGPVLPGSGGQEMKQSCWETVMDGVEDSPVLVVYPFPLSCFGSPNLQTTGSEFRL